MELRGSVKAFSILRREKDEEAKNLVLEVGNVTGKNFIKRKP